MFDASLYSVTVGPRQVTYKTPLGRGVEVVVVYFTTQNPRIIIYAEETRDVRTPVSKFVDDINWLVEDAKSRLVAQGTNL